MINRDIGKLDKPERNITYTHDKNQENIIVNYHYPELDNVEHFEFHFKIHKLVAGIYLGLRTVNQKNDWLCGDPFGWGLRFNGDIYHANRKIITIKELAYKEGDVVKFRVNKREKKVYGALNNGNDFIFLFEMVANQVTIAANCYYMDEKIEFLYFEDLSPLNRLEIEEMFKKFSEKMKKGINQENEKLKKEMINLREENARNLRKLSNENLKLKKGLQESINENLRIRKDFETHMEKFHIIKYEIESIRTIPALGRTENNDYFCFQEDTVEFEILFTAFSGNEKMGQIMSDFDFKDLHIQFNNELVKDVQKMPRSIEFERKMDDVGDNTILVKYRNINKMFKVVVLESKICNEKSRIVLRKKGGDEDTEFFVDDEINVFLEFRNIDGIGLPFGKFKDFEPGLKVFQKGQKKSIKQMFLSMDIENYDENEKGLIFVVSLKLKAGTKSGEYEIKISDLLDFNLEKKFVLKNEE